MGLNGRTGFRTVVALVVIGGFVVADLGDSAGADPTTPDTSFGSSGFVMLPGTFASSLAVQPDGSVLVGYRGDPPTGSVTRLLPDGVVDTSFGAGGVASVAMVPNDLLLTGGGDVFVVGDEPSSGDGVVVELQSDGQTVQGFGSNGATSIVCPSGSVDLVGAALTTSGGVVVAGSCDDSGFGAVVDSNGLLDPGFGDIQDSSVSSFDSVLTRPDGSYIFAGMNQYNSSVFEGVTADGTSLAGFTNDSSGIGGGPPSLLAAPEGRFYMALGLPSDHVFPLVSEWNSNGTAYDPYGFGSGYGDLEFASWNVYYGAAAAPDGSVVVVGGSGLDGAIGRLDPAGISDPAFALNGWATLAAQFAPEAVAIKADGQVVMSGEIEGHAVVEQLDGGSLQTIGFTRVPGEATAIGQGADGTVWVAGTGAAPGGHPIFRWTGTTWIEVPGGATNIAVGPDGIPWVINSNNQIFQDTTNGWKLQPGAATAIAVAPDGTAWVAGTGAAPGGHPIFRWTGTTWIEVPGGATNIAVGPDGTPWVINSNNQIFQDTTNGWKLQPGAATAIGQGADGAVWVAGSGAVPGGHPIFRWTGTTWIEVPGGATNIAVGLDGTPWVTNSHAQIFRS